MSIKLVCAMNFLLVTSAFAEPTPVGGVATFNNGEGKPFTYYDIDGNPLPPGTKIFLAMEPRGGLIYENGQATNRMAYDSKETAAYWKERGSTADTSGAVFGPSGNTTIAKYDESDYQKKSFELTTLLFGAAEVGAKSCKPAGKAMPKSLAGWWSAVKAYKEGEIIRDKLLNDKVDGIRAKMEEIIGNKTAKEMQTEAIQIQIDSVSASIDSISGSYGRIPLREKLVMAALKSNKENSDDDLKFVETYEGKLNKSGFDVSLLVATDACKRKKKEKTCETNEEGVETCKEEEKDDPVPGCKEAMAQIPKIQSGAAKDYQKLYLLPSMASISLNEKMGDLEVSMKEQIAAIPKSSDPEYDWHTPMESNLNEMKTTRKDGGVLCPNSSLGENKSAPGGSKITSNAKDFLGTLGIIGEEATAVGDVLAEAWDAADVIIGQPGNRGNYFDEMKDKVNGLLTMDRAKLAELIAQRNKLRAYLQNINTELGTKLASASTSKTSASAGAAANKAPEIKPIATVTQAAQAVGRVNEYKGNDNLNFNQSISPSELGDSISVKGRITNTLSGVPLNASGLSSATLANAGLSLSDDNFAMANRFIADMKKNEAKMSKVTGNSTYTTTSASKAKAESSYRSAQTASKKSFSDALKLSMNSFDSSPSSGSIYRKSAIGNLNINAEDGGPQATSKTEIQRAQELVSSFSKDKEKESDKKDKIIKKTVTTSYSKPTTSISTSSSSSSESKTEEAGAVVNSAEKTENARVISQTIAAKKTKKKDAYDTKEDDSLFDRVTKAYIRNYEKIEEEKPE